MMINNINNEGKPSDVNLRKYIDSLKLETKNKATLDLLDYSWKVWEHISGYFLLNNTKILEVPDACIGEDNGFMYTWEKGNHYFECEIFLNKKLEWFYRHKSQSEISFLIENTLDDPFDDLIFAILSIFVCTK